MHNYTLYRSCIKVDRKDQIDVGCILVLDKAWGLWIHHVNIDLFIIDHTEGIDEKLRVETDHNVLSGFMDHQLCVHGTKAGI